MLDRNAIKELPQAGSIYQILDDVKAMREYFNNIALHIGATEEQLQKSREYLAKQSKEQLQQMILEIVNRAGDSDKLKIVNAQNKFVRETQGDGTAAILKKPADKIDDQTKKEFIERLRASHTSDEIHLTYAEDKALWELAKEKDINSIPSDIFFADTIPLKDIKIVCDERGFIEGGTVCDFRVVVFDDQVKKLSEKELLDITCVGVMILNKPFRCKLYIPLYVQNGFDFVAPADYWWERPGIYAPATNGMLAQSLVEYLSTWYGVQISLLHPRIKTIYDKPLRVPIHIKGNKPAKRRKIEYLKIHKIKIKDIDSLIYDDHKKINRKCLCWYVIGHWRQYKNGKKSFVQGYWKGALRETKRNYDEGRERVVKVGGEV